jgi:uncharacterized protein YbjT (DUF2867 family)
VILILGATGMFGSRVLRETVARGVNVRALVHSRAKAESFEGQANVEVALGDLDEPETLRGAFKGIDTAFLVTSMDGAIATREGNALRAAQEAGVRRVVKLYGAVRHHGDSLDALHRASIDAIRASGLEWALVSPSSVMESSLLSQAEAVKYAGSLFGCAGDGRVGLIAADDVGRAAAVVLTERDEQGANYELTGPAALTMAEMAARFSEVLGREITYQDMPEPEFRSLLVEEGGVPEDQVDVKAMLHFAAWKRGDADLVTDTYRELTGESPVALSDWIREHRSAFAGEER